MLKHNKKRNIGLLNEFFAQYIANAVVEFRYDDVEKAKSLWQKSVLGNKNLCEEFKVFEMLNKTFIKDVNVANNLLKKAESIISEQNHNEVEKSKTALLHEINRQLKDNDFFTRPVERGKYQTYANIQMLINNWRDEDKGNIFSNEAVFKLQDRILEHVTTIKGELPPLDVSLLNNTKEDIDHMVVNVFKEKIDKKYNNFLNEEQKNLIGLFVFSEEKESKEKLANLLEGIKTKTLSEIEKELESKNANSPKKKLEEVKSYLASDHYDIANPNDETISFYLSVSDLKHELES